MHVYQVVYEKAPITVAFMFSRIPTEDEFNEQYFRVTSEYAWASEPPIPGFDVFFNRMRGLEFKEVQFPVGNTKAKVTIVRLEVVELPCESALRESPSN